MCAGGAHHSIHVFRVFSVRLDSYRALYRVNIGIVFPHQAIAGGVHLGPLHTCIVVIAEHYSLHEVLLGG